jgi:PleD family two-component response regulator
MNSETKTCLLVSADVELQTVVDSRLSARGYQVVSVSSIADSLHRVEHETPDLILLDAEVEKVSESELLAKIKSVTLSLCIPLILIAQENRLSSLIMCVEQGFDDFITKPVDVFQLVLRVAMNLKRMEDRGQVNPLSKLPGNSAINRKIEQLIEDGERFSVCYMDINNFKAFNDCYGYSKGDDVIKQTAGTAWDSVKKLEVPTWAALNAPTERFKANAGNDAITKGIEQFRNNNPWVDWAAGGLGVGAAAGLASGLIRRKRNKHRAIGDALTMGLLGGLATGSEDTF